MELISTLPDFLVLLMECLLEGVVASLLLGLAAGGLQAPTDPSTLALPCQGSLSSLAEAHPSVKAQSYSMKLGNVV